MTSFFFLLKLFFFHSNNSTYTKNHKKLNINPIAKQTTLYNLVIHHHRGVDALLLIKEISPISKKLHTVNYSLLFSEYHGNAE